MTGSRFLFPEDRMSFVYGRPGDPIRTPPRTALKIFLDEAGTQPADIQTPTGTSIPFSTIYTADDSLLPEFLGPESFVVRVWARVVGGHATTYPLIAQYSDQMANIPMLTTGDGPPAPVLGAVGSYYIDRADAEDPVLYGPRTLAGWPGTGVPIRGPQGIPGASDEWVQASPNDEWTITHSLPFRPAVTTINSAGEQVYGDVHYPLANPHQIVVRFGAPESGTALLT